MAVKREVGDQQAVTEPHAESEKLSGVGAQLGVSLPDLYLLPRTVVAGMFRSA